MKKREFNPTPGEWKYDEKPGVVYAMSCKNEVSHVAIMAVPHDGEINANARLVINAKRMYGLLSCIKGVLETCNCEKCIDCALEHEIDKLLKDVEDGE